MNNLLAPEGSVAVVPHCCTSVVGLWSLSGPVRPLPPNDVALLFLGLFSPALLSGADYTKQMAAVSRAFNACDGCGPPLPPLGDFCTGKRAMAERDWPATDRDCAYGDVFGRVGVTENEQRSRWC
ncbi:hypothetical protein MHYP_G00037220 [Metynnis hypsauchen]